MGSITLSTDADDYISPSQACINPLFTPASKSTRTEKKTIDNNEMSNTRPRTRRRKPLILEDPSSSAQYKSTNLRSKGRAAILSYDNDQDDGTNIHATSASVPSAIHQPKKKSQSTATVSIADCLACSGCITSSEAVLVGRHSVQNLLHHFDSNSQDNIVVFTISPSSVANLCYTLHGNDYVGEDMDIILTVVLRKLASFLRERFGAQFLFSGEVTQKISLINSALEFCQRYQHARGERNIGNAGAEKKLQRKEKFVSNDAHVGMKSRIEITTPSVALSSCRSRYLVRSTTKGQGNLEGLEMEHGVGRDKNLHFLNHNVEESKPMFGGSTIPNSSILPMLSSSCPGFVCYVEKNVFNAIPNLTTVKSPMALAGYLLKHDNAQEENLEDYRRPITAEVRGNNEVPTKRNVFHVSIMPCHDKKLEAERKDLAHEKKKRVEANDDLPDLSRDVDLVITTNELWTILEDTAMEHKNSLSINRQNEGHPMPMQYRHNTKEKVSASMGSQGSSLDHVTVVRDYFRSLPLAPTASWTKLHPSSDQVQVIIEENDSVDKDDDNLSYAPSTLMSSISKTMNGSGSYAEFIFRFASHYLFGHEIQKDEELPWREVSTRRRRRDQKAGRWKTKTERGIHATRMRGSNTTISADYCEVFLYRHKDGSFSCHDQSNHVTPTGAETSGDIDNKEDEIVLKFAIAYGFKNIQLITQHSSSSSGDNTRMKMHDYDYIEVMACPSGCLNGGGQISFSTSPLNSSSNIRETPSDVRGRVMTSKKFMRDVMPHFTDKSRENGASRINVHNPMLYTRFHAIPKLELASGATAGVAVDDTLW